MLKEEQVQGRVLDHIGLIAATIGKVGLTEMVDRLLPVSEERGAKISMGQRVSAMILNGLGFMHDRLYMFPDFLANKPVDRLFGCDVTSDMFNDDALGRCLDSISGYGVTKLFSEIAFTIGSAFNLLGGTSRFDTTSLSVHGQYDTDGSDGTIEITHGYSKDSRPDLKQMTLNLATTGAGSFPIWMEAHSGNASDKAILQQAAVRMKKFCEQLQDAPSFIFVGDSAMYEKCISKNTNDLLWLSRVPGTIKQERVLTRLPDSEVAWQVIDNNYKVAEFNNGYGNIQQRWLLISSKQGHEREVKTMERGIAAENAACTKALAQLSHKSFGCEQDAYRAVRDMQKKLKYHEVAYKLEQQIKHAGKGRPKPDAPVETSYRVHAAVTPNAARIEECRCSKGRFILATNQLNRGVLSSADMLREYKEQSKTEQGFRFIKGNAFDVAAVFLKTPSRIQALMMIMCLCLMIYALAELFMRQAMKEAKETIPNQLKKPTQKPTLAWVCRLFHGVHLLLIDLGDRVQELVINLNAIIKQIVCYFGKRAEEIYGLNTT